MSWGAEGGFLFLVVVAITATLAAALVLRLVAETSKRYHRWRDKRFERCLRCRDDIDPDIRRQVLEDHYLDVHMYQEIEDGRAGNTTVVFTVQYQRDRYQMNVTKFPPGSWLDFVPYANDDEGVEKFRQQLREKELEESSPRVSDDPLDE